MIEHWNLALNVAILVLGGFGFFWLAIHSRRWAVAYQASKVDQHERQIGYLRESYERLQTNQHDLITQAADSSAKVWSKLDEICARLDRMQCPMHLPDCPLSQRLPDGDLIWSAEQREAYRKTHKKEEGEG